MLTTAEEDRLEETLPTSGTVSYDGQEQQYGLTPFWAGPDASGDDATASPDYPMLVFDWEQQDVPAEERQPVDNIHEIENPANVEEYREVHTNELFSDLVIQAVVRRQWLDGLPPGVRLKQLTRPIRQTCSRDLANHGQLNEPGPNGERPMTVDILTGVTGNRDDDTSRVQWTIRLHYRGTHEVIQETVEDAEYSVDTT